MAVDLSLLPIEEPEPDDPRSRFFWTVMFLALLLVCVFAVLLVWPKNMPTAPRKFWTSVTLFPVGLGTLASLRTAKRILVSRMSILVSTTKAAMATSTRARSTARCMRSKIAKLAQWHKKDLV
ncbi:hypothetical protein [Caballeronia zhejiangensis]|uniref:hypothetical protein n=1 Tax=Caballeronia zhejiangensis TaxID=871203 RepID=UPI00142FBCA0|nr:hypothetical protein [Caballeronia zhejiangensis]